MLASLEAALLEAPSAVTNSRIKPVQFDAGRGVGPGTERGSPPFSRPLDPAASKDQASQTGSGNATLVYPVVGARGFRRRPRLVIISSILLAGLAITAGTIGWGRLHKPVAALSMPTSSPASISAQPPSLTAFRWSNESGGVPSSVVFSSDGRRVVAAVSSDSGGVRGWEAATGRPNLAALQGSPVTAVAFPLGPDTSELFLGNGGSIVRWSLMQEAAHVEAPHVKGEIGSLAWGGSPNGKHVLAVQTNSHLDGVQPRLLIFNDKLLEMEFEMPGKRDALSFCFLGNTSLLATGSSDTKIRLWMVNTLDYSHGYPLLSTIDNDVAVHSLASSADGTIMASAGHQSVQFFLIRNNGQLPNPAQRIGKVFRPGHDCRSLAMSPDGMTAAVGSGGDLAGDVTIYDVNAGQMIAELTGFGGAVISVAFSPDGSLLATGSMDHTVKTWDLKKLLPDRAAPSPATRPAQVPP
jgi:WD40 repeat protein